MDIHNALVTLRPKSSFVQRGPDYSGLEWADGNSEAKPTESEIQAKIAELQAEHDSQAYARSRKAEYPSIEELVVALYDTDDKAAVEAKRAAVKAKYPKPS